MNASYFDRAVSAHARRCERDGLIFDQPDHALSSESESLVVLRNVNGHIASYSVHNGRLRFIDGGDGGSVLDGHHRIRARGPIAAATA
jgi:hypothetical protein